MRTKQESPTQVAQWFREQAASLWPAALGSLSLRRTRCMRDRCPACLKGNQHPSHVLYGRIKGRRFGVYIPDELAPEVSRCLDNGRALQDLLYQAGQRYANALKHERTIRIQEAKK